MDARLQNPSAFRRELLRIEPRDREQWFDGVLGIDDLPDDAEDLPPGCVPYLPCSVDILLRVVERAHVTPDDVFVDVGSGLGRAMTLVHLLTGAETIGLEIQRGLALQAQAMAERLHLDHVRTLHGDAEHLISHTSLGSVFFFYCPFGGDRSQRVLAELRSLATVRPLRLCFVDMPAPDLPWLEVDPTSRDDEPFVICDTRLHTHGSRYETVTATKSDVTRLLPNSRGVTAK